MTFDEWYEEAAIPHETKTALRDCWTAAQFALNSELGIAANEAAKAERLAKAIHEAIDLIEGNYMREPWHRKLEAIIKAAQG